MAFDFTLVIDDRLFMATDYGLSLQPNRSEAMDEDASSGATTQDGTAVPTPSVSTVNNRQQNIKKPDTISI